MFMKRLYRFALKRLIGPFLVNNDIAIKDLDVKLRDRTVELRNLNLDTDVLNDSLGLAELNVISATVSNVTLAGKDEFSVKVTGIRVVVEPRGINATKRRKEKVAASSLDGDEDEITEESGDGSTDQGSSSTLTEGLNSVEGWIERSINMLKVEISDVRIEIRMPSDKETDFPHHLLIHVAQCTSQSNPHTASRETELFGVDISLIQKAQQDGEEVSMRLMYIAPSSGEAGNTSKVCLIRAAQDESFRERGYEITLWSIQVSLTPRSLQMLLAFCERFSYWNRQKLAPGTRRVKIKDRRWSSAESDNDGTNSETDGGANDTETEAEAHHTEDDDGEEDEFFDAQASAALSVASEMLKHRSTSETNSEHNELPKTSSFTRQPGSTVFHISVNAIVVNLCYENERPCFRLLGEGVMLDNSVLSVHRLEMDVGDSADSVAAGELKIDVKNNPSENSLTFFFENRRMELTCSFVVETSTNFKTLYAIMEAYQCAFSSSLSSKESSVLVTSAQPSSPYFSLESLPMLEVRLKGQRDVVLLTLNDIKSEDMLSATASTGVLSVISLDPLDRESLPVIYLRKFIKATLVEVATSVPSSAVDGNEVFFRSADDEEGVDLQEVSGNFESEASVRASAVVDVCIGRIESPKRLDRETFQRTVAVLLECGGTREGDENKTSSDEEETFLTSNLNGPCVRLSCSSGSITFNAPDVALPPSRVEFHDLSTTSFGLGSVVRVQHICLSELIDRSADRQQQPVTNTKGGLSKDEKEEENVQVVPLANTSQFASHVTSTLLAFVQRQSHLDASLRVLAANLTFRYEAEALGLTSLLKCLVPDGRGTPEVVGYQTNVTMTLENWVLDVFPSQSPYRHGALTSSSSGYDHSSIPSSRLFVAVSKMQVATLVNASSAVIARYDVDLSEAHVYLAQRSSRGKTEHMYHSQGSRSVLLQEYAERKGFVRIGEMLRASVFLRLEYDTLTDSTSMQSSLPRTELELVVPVCKMMTCADSLHRLLHLLGVIAGGTTSSNRKQLETSSSPKSPIVILPAGSVQSHLDLLGTAPSSSSSHALVPDSELPASQLRARIANAPDSTLNAKQLQIRYRKEPYLLPHVIEDYYSIGSLPNKSKQEGDSSHKSIKRKGKKETLTAVSPPPGDWVSEFDMDDDDEVSSSAIGEDDDDDEEVEATPSGFGRLQQQKVPQPSSTSVLHAQSTAKTPKRTHQSRFEENNESDDDDESDGSLGMMRSILFSPPPPSQSFFKGQEEPEDVMMQPIELIAKEDIASGALRGVAEAKRLQESLQTIVQSALESEHFCNDMADDEANLYKTALLASSMMVNPAAGETKMTATKKRVSTKVAPKEELPAADVWHPGKALLVDVEGDDDNDDDDDDEEEDGVGRYFDGDTAAKGIQVRNFHIPIPTVPQPGSFLPPTAAIAARMEGEGSGSFSSSYATQQRGSPLKGLNRIILRDCNVSWSLFGGSDFAKPLRRTGRDILFEPVGSEEEEDDDEVEEKGGWDSDRRLVARRSDLRVVENHFGLFSTAGDVEGTSATGKPTASASRPSPFGRRDVDRAIELNLLGVSLLFDSFGDGATTSSLAVRDLEIVDNVRASPVKKLFQHWDNERLHPRYTAADMVRMTWDVSARGSNHQIKAAFLPIRLVVNQDTLELLASFTYPGQESPPQQAGNEEDQKSYAVHFEYVDFRALKLKIDYYPNRVNVAKLREGKYAELVHLFSYEGMEVALKRAEFRNVIGSDQLLTQLTEYWAQDVFNKQLYQLLAGVSPAIKNIATDLADIVLLPVDVFKGKAPSSSVGKKAQQFAKTIVVQSCGLGKKMTSAALNLLDDKRTRRVPKDAPEGLTVAGHALASRMKSAHHTIIAVPLMTWQREGATGALRSVIRAIPVAVIQPVLGLGEAVEAISSGLQFHVDPEEYREDTRRWKT